MNTQQIWQATMGQLQMEMSKAAFDTWISNAELVSYERDIYTIGVQNAYARDWLDSRLTSTVSCLLTGLTGQPQSVRFVVSQNDYDTNDSNCIVEEEKPSNPAS